jgi:hypothetical protein
MPLARFHRVIQVLRFRRHRCTARHKTFTHNSSQQRAANRQRKHTAAPQLQSSTSRRRSDTAAMGLLAPAEGINYNFILGMYSFFLALGALFAGLEFVMGVEAVKGFYLVFAPFVPAFMWCTVVRSAWLSAKAKKD